MNASHFSADLHPSNLYPLFFVYFVLLWLVTSAIISALSGWSKLAAVYRRTGPFRGDVWHFQSGRMKNFMRYNNCLTIGANAGGLYLSMLFIFRTGHPPLFIPWSDIMVTAPTPGSDFIELHFRRVPDITLILSERLRRNLAGAAGYSWPGEEE